MIQGVQVILINNDSKLLIAKRARFRQDGSIRIGADRWNFIGGKLEKNELPFQAAIREVKEEAGIVLNNLKKLSEKINPWDPEYDPFYAYLFVASIKDNQVKLDEEHTAYEFVSIEELDQYNLLGYNSCEIKSELKDILC